MSMFSIVAEFGPDIEDEPEVVIRLKPEVVIRHRRVGTWLKTLDPSKLHYVHQQRGIANVRRAPIFVWL